ncbi:3133_t:CDS:1, partial [Ambispora gerdemannii]
KQFYHTGRSHSQLKQLQKISGDGRGQRLGGGSLVQEATDGGVNPY